MRRLVVSASEYNNKQSMTPGETSNRFVLLRKPFKATGYFLPCRPHLSPLAAGQGVSVQHLPQHSPSNGGINPEQPEAVVVVLDFIYNPLSERPSHRFCIQRGAVHRPSFLQLLLLVL